MRGISTEPTPGARNLALECAQKILHLGPHEQLQHPRRIGPTAPVRSTSVCHFISVPPSLSLRSKVPSIVTTVPPPLPRTLSFPCSGLRLSDFSHSSRSGAPRLSGTFTFAVQWLSSLMSMLSTAGISCAIRSGWSRMSQTTSGARIRSAWFLRPSSSVAPQSHRQSLEGASASSSDAGCRDRRRLLSSLRLAVSGCFRLADSRASPSGRPHDAARFAFFERSGASFERSRRLL